MILQLTSQGEIDVATDYCDTNQRLLPYESALNTIIIIGVGVYSGPLRTGYPHSHNISNLGIGFPSSSHGSDEPYCWVSYSGYSGEFKSNLGSW